MVKVIGDIQLVSNSKSQILEISEDISYLYILVPKKFRKMFDMINPCFRITLQEVKK